jgi:hypothetical protein
VASIIALAGLCILLIVVPVYAQVAESHPDDVYWERGPDVPGIDGTVYCLTEFDGQLIAGGLFEVANDTLAICIASWDGTNNDGALIASGVYVYRLQAGKETLSKKMVLLK